MREVDSERIEKIRKGLDLGARLTHKIGIAFAGTCVGNAR